MEDLGKHIYEIILVLAIYIFISLLVSYYYKINNQKNSTFVQIFTPIFIAVLVLPLFLGSMGNNSLEDILKGDFTSFDIFEFMAYVTIIAIAGRKVVDLVLDSMNLKDFEDKLIDVEEDIQDVLETQNDMTYRQGLYDFENKALNNDEVDLLIQISKKQEIFFEEENEALEKLKSLRYISKSKDIDGTIKCSLTKIGLDYLKLLNEKD